MTPGFGPEGKRTLRNETEGLAHVMVPPGLGRERICTAKGEGKPDTCNGASGFAERRPGTCNNASGFPKKENWQVCYAYDVLCFALLCELSLA